MLDASPQHLLGAAALRRGGSYPAREAFLPLGVHQAVNKNYMSRYDECSKEKKLGMVV